MFDPICMKIYLVHCIVQQLYSFHDILAQTQLARIFLLRLDIIFFWTTELKQNFHVPFQIETVNFRLPVHCIVHICLCSCCFGLVTKAIIKISTHPCYPRKFNWFSWGWRIKNLVYYVILLCTYFVLVGALNWKNKYVFQKILNQFL